MHKNKLKQHTHTLYLLLLKSVMISIICDCVLQGERFQWAMQLRPGWLSKFMPTVSYMRPPFKYHSKLAKSIASIDLKTKPCGCTKTKTTHTCTLPFDVKICNDQYIMWLCVLQLTGREVSMSDAIKTRLIINAYAHCILHEAALQISQQAGKKHRYQAFWFRGIIVTAAKSECPRLNTDGPLTPTMTSQTATRLWFL